MCDKVTELCQAFFCLVHSGLYAWNLLCCDNYTDIMTGSPGGQCLISS